MATSAIPPFPDEGRSTSRQRLAMATRIDHLRALPLFAACSKRQLSPLARAARVEQYEAGQAVFSEGDPAVEAGIVIAGRLEVRRGRRKVAELGPGELVGELGLLLGDARSATVVTTAPTELLLLGRRELRDAVDTVPGLGWVLLQTVAQRLGPTGAPGTEDSTAAVESVSERAPSLRGV